MPPIPFLWIDALLYDNVPGLKELDARLGACNIPRPDPPSYNQSLYLLNLTKEGAIPELVKNQYITQLESTIVLSNTATGETLTSLLDQKIELLEKFLGIYQPK